MNGMKPPRESFVQVLLAMYLAELTLRSAGAVPATSQLRAFLLLNSMVFAVLSAVWLWQWVRGVSERAKAGGVTPIEPPAAPIAPPLPGRGSAIAEALTYEERTLREALETLLGEERWLEVRPPLFRLPTRPELFNPHRLHVCQVGGERRPLAVLHPVPTDADWMAERARLNDDAVRARVGRAPVVLLPLKASYAQDELRWYLEKAGLVLPEAEEA